ncbi:MAG: ice-binding family protein [Chloroflexi bacterium]|nr:ice-binding family protein [Chloroflexota bacterium]
MTCTDSTITGNLGALAAVTQTTCSVSGTVTTPISAAVSVDFEAKYAALGAATCDPLNTNIPLAGATLVPGVYCFDSFVALTDTTLTLDGPADGIWIFKVGTLGTGYLEATNLSVVMANGAWACNVSWWVAAYATLTGNTAGAANSSGTILAAAAITSTGTATNSTFVSSALARAAVTLTNTDLTGCATIAVPGDDDHGDKDDDDHDRGDKDHGDKDHGNKDHGDKDHGNTIKGHRR